MIVYSERYGYEIEFSHSIQQKLMKLNKDKFEDLRDAVEEAFPLVEGFHTDLVTLNPFMQIDPHDNQNDAREQTRELDKNLKAFINNWIKTNIK